ncbi:MAG: hypothetical protein IJ292_04960 [Clostridia bacterium]|nr:hypothetical protein [Clostridia bacterium]
MKKFKKIFKKILPIALIVLVVVSSCVYISQRINYVKSGIFEYEIRDFKDYKKSFELVSDKLWECYYAEKEKNDITKMMLSGMLEDTWIIDCYMNESEKYEITITLTEDVGRATSIIKEAFRSSSNEGLWFVTVTDKQIAFASGKVPYAIIRVKGFSRPDYLFSPDKPDKAYFKKISGKWYHGIRLTT